MLTFTISSYKVLCVAAMKAEGEVARMAVQYLRCRSIAAPVSLAMFVATGSFRGFKDTK